MTTLKVADLFAGAGGASTGFVQAAMAMIGNAVEVNNARALASVMVDSILGRERRAA